MAQRELCLMFQETCLLPVTTATGSVNPTPQARLHPQFLEILTVLKDFRLI